MINTNTTMGNPKQVIYENQNQQLIDQKKKSLSPEEFIVWFRGFVQGSHHHNLTPSGWDTVKDTLGKVSPNNNESVKFDSKRLLND